MAQAAATIGTFQASPLTGWHSLVFAVKGLARSSWLVGAVVSIVGLARLVLFIGRLGQFSLSRFIGALFFVTAGGLGQCS